MKKKKKKQQVIPEVNFYSLDKILAEDAHYNLIYGQRSNGKSFSVEELGLKNYIDYGEQMAIIRRYDVDFQGKRGQGVFEHFIHNEYRGNIVSEITGGEWTDIYYWSMRWYLCKYNEKGERIRKEEPFCYAFSLAGQEHDKSTSYPKITTILFDEFMTRGLYLPDEFITFTNVLSTIIRERDNVRIFMCGNTVNKYNPYFKEMGLDNILMMKPGDLQVYKFAAYGDKILKIAVEYSDNPNKDGKPSDVYFAFNNPKLQMITNGVWEMAIYPHCPVKYETKDIIHIYFIIWEGEILQCEIVQLNYSAFTFIHRKTTPIKDEDTDIVYSTTFDYRPNWRRKITRPIDDIDRKLYKFFLEDNVFYQDNEVGEIVRNYINWSKSDRGFV